MSARRNTGTPLSRILRIVDELNDADRLTLFEYLRPERVRAKAAKKAASGGKQKSAIVPLASDNTEDKLQGASA